MGVALLAVWLSVFVDHGTESVEVPTFLIGAIGTGAILFLAFGLFRGPNLTRYPKGSPFSIGSGVAAVSLVIAGYTMAGVATKAPQTPSETVAMSVLSAMAFLGALLAFRVQQAAAAQSHLISRGIPVGQILLGRDHGLASIFHAPAVAAALEGHEVVVYRASLAGATEFARVPSSEVFLVREEGKHKMTVVVGVGYGAGGVEIRAVPIWEWKDFAASRDAITEYPPLVGAQDH